MRAAIAPIATVEGKHARIEAVKLAEDGSGDLIIRLYESLGGRTSTRLLVDTEFTLAVETDLHERAIRHLDVVANGERSSVSIVLRPFQILTVRLAMTGG